MSTLFTNWMTCLLVGASLCSALSAQARFDLVGTDTVHARLNQYKGDDRTREKTLFGLFSEAGCAPAHLSEQAVPKRREPNVICILPGETEDRIVVGAHFDHVSRGSGVVDNWSGASLLPSLFQSLAAAGRKHTFIFVGFTGEEAGEIGSNYYVNQLSSDDMERIGLMVNIDTIGLGPTKVWASRSDTRAVKLLGAAARSLNLPLGVMDVDNYGESDEEPFLMRKARTITIHSLTPATAGILHTAKDATNAIDFREYYYTYHLLAGYLAVLDTRPEADGPKGPEVAPSLMK